MANLPVASNNCRFPFFLLKISSKIVLNDTLDGVGVVGVCTGAAVGCVEGAYKTC